MAGAEAGRTRPAAAVAPKAQSMLLSSYLLQAGIPLIKAVQHGDVEARRVRKVPFAALD